MVKITARSALARTLLALAAHWRAVSGEEQIPWVDVEVEDALAVNVDQRGEPAKRGCEVGIS